jgi:hypothetical protein
MEASETRHSKDANLSQLPPSLDGRTHCLYIGTVFDKLLYKIM